MQNHIHPCPPTGLQLTHWKHLSIAAPTASKASKNATSQKSPAQRSVKNKGKAEYTTSVAKSTSITTEADFSMDEAQIMAEMDSV